MTLRYSRRFLSDARLLEERATLERRAEEVLNQDKLAPRRWAARLAPEDIPEFPGFEVGRVYEAGTGLMAGDFYDVFLAGPQRLAAVIGDVSGHGIEPSITAFQVKYLLRVFLRQYRDPAQALEELNTQIWSPQRGEEFVSLFVGIFDQAAHTLRFASAGHPPAWFWHDGEVRSLRATGPLLTIDPRPTTAAARSTSRTATSCSSTLTVSPRRGRGSSSSARSASPGTSGATPVSAPPSCASRCWQRRVTSPPRR
jgi:serine phosphatase RsbU (regulator of sigma subunit)